MMATPHMMAGAVIGKFSRRAWLAWPLAFLSHFLLDITPHLDAHNLFGVANGRPTAPEALMAIADFAVGAAVVTWLAWRRPNRRAVLGAALFAILIDLVEYVPPFAFWFPRWPGARALADFHHAFQANVPRNRYSLGIATQVAAMALALLYLLRPGPQPESRSSSALDPHEER